jgi:N-carbamoylputrescine amidase
MSKLRVALLPMASQGRNQDANLAKGESFCRRAKNLGADVALFPEMWSERRFIGAAGVHLSEPQS